MICNIIYYVNIVFVKLIALSTILVYKNHTVGNNYKHKREKERKKGFGNVQKS